MFSRNSIYDAFREFSNAKALEKYVPTAKDIKTYPVSQKAKKERQKKVSVLNDDSELFVPDIVFDSSDDNGELGDDNGDWNIDPALR